MYLQISQKSQENTCSRASFLIKRLWHRCLPMDFAEFLRTYFFRTLLDDCFLVEKMKSHIGTSSDLLVYLKLPNDISCVLKFHLVFKWYELLLQLKRNLRLPAIFNTVENLAAPYFLKIYWINILNQIFQLVRTSKFYKWWNLYIFFLKGSFYSRCFIRKLYCCTRIFEKS